MRPIVMKVAQPQDLARRSSLQEGAARLSHTVALAAEAKVALQKFAASTFPNLPLTLRWEGALNNQLGAIVADTHRGRSGRRRRGSGPNNEAWVLDGGLVGFASPGDGCQRAHRAVRPSPGASPCWRQNRQRRG